MDLTRYAKRLAGFFVLIINYLEFIFKKYLNKFVFVIGVILPLTYQKRRKA